MEKEVMRKSKPIGGMPPQVGRGFMPPKVTAGAPLMPKSSPKQGGASRIRNLGEYAHPQKKKKK
jgi:hypothetical protein